MVTGTSHPRPIFSMVTGTLLLLLLPLLKIVIKMLNKHEN
jgi:hypothetical protein